MLATFVTGFAGIRRRQARRARREEVHEAGQGVKVCPTAFPEVDECRRAVRIAHGWQALAREQRQGHQPARA